MKEAIAVILAAGESKRMGLPKALLAQEKGKSFLGQLLRTFDRADCDALVVVGKDGPAIREQHPEAVLVENPGWQEGQFSSVRVGLRAALDEGAEQILIHPVDIPLIRNSTLLALKKALAQTETEGVVPEFDGAPGHPLVLRRAAAEKILALEGVTTLEQAQKALSILRLKTQDPAVLVDLNTPEIYARVLGESPRLAPPPKRRVKSND